MIRIWVWPLESKIDYLKSEQMKSAEFSRTDTDLRKL